MSCYSIEKSEIQKKRSANKYGSHFEHFWVCLQVFVLWGLAGMKKSHPGATVNHQLYEGDETPLIIAIVSPLMKRVHKEIPQ